MTSRVVLICGASSGIGLATALRFAGSGDRLALMARDPESLARAVAQCREAGARDVIQVPGNIARQSDVQQAVRTTVDRYGRLDAVVQSAMVMAYGQVEQLPAEVFRAVVDTATLGTFHLAQAVLPVFRRQRRGTLVVINSLLGEATVPDMGAYATAKWAQRALVRTLQQETRKASDVHVCMVSPGGINTPIYYQAATYTERQARPPFPVLKPERVAETVARLLERPRRNVSVRVGPVNPVILAGFRFLPSVYDRIVGALFRIASLSGPKIEPTPGNVLEPKPDGERLHGRWPAD
ncbi:MAG TPA: SDR family NAD(P)-dependent oxidoreductase [Jatrophihabitans sp.]|nr:SDR family NAD(P)-dependent oxidoreductase [Jatrophihabitans sp.]